MIGESWPLIGDLLGLGADSLALWQMALRSVMAYVVAIALVRLGEKRFLGQYAAVDAILGFTLGSLLGSAITGGAPYFETLFGGALAMVLMHWLFAVLSFHSDRIGDLVKGSKRLLVSDGDIQWDAMQRTHISEQDLRAIVRTSAQLAELKHVKEAHLERSGNISVIERERSPSVIEIKVQNGVQVVRLEMT